MAASPASDRSNNPDAVAAVPTVADVSRFITKETETWLKSFVAGGIAGATAKTIIAPLDRIKIMFQVSNQPFSFRGVWQELTRTFHHEGFRALFKGNSAQMLRVYPYSGIQLSSFDQYSKLLLAEKRALAKLHVSHGAAVSQGSAPSASTGSAGHKTMQLSPHERVIAGAAAGATSVACTYPLDLMRARLAVQREVAGGDRRYRGLAHAFKSMYAEHGWHHFYRGMAPTLLGILPYAGISFATYGTLKQLSKDRNGGRDPTHLERLAYGGVSGLAGQSMTYPLDIVRRRMQTEGYTPLHAHAASAAQQAEKLVSQHVRDPLPDGGGSSGTGAGGSGNGAAGQSSSGAAGGGGARSAAAGAGVPHHVGSAHNEVHTGSGWPNKLGRGASTFHTHASSMAGGHQMHHHAGWHGIAGGPPTSGLAGMAYRALSSAAGPDRLQEPGSRLGRLVALIRRTEGGMVDTLQHVYAREGRRGLFKGLSMNVVKGPIAVGVSFTTYDLLKRLLGIEEVGGGGGHG